MRRVAAGGFGVVYQALGTDDQPVAIKEYLPSSLATRAPGELAPTVAPEKLSLYRLGLKSFFSKKVARLRRSPTLRWSAC